jgi:hypothetical protein
MNVEQIELLQKIGINPDGSVFDYLLQSCGVRAAVMVKVFGGSAWLIDVNSHVWFVPSWLSDSDFAWNPPSEGVSASIQEVQRDGGDITENLLESTRVVFRLPI